MEKQLRFNYSSSSRAKIIFLTLSEPVHAARWTAPRVASARVPTVVWAVTPLRRTKMASTTWDGSGTQEDLMYRDECILVVRVIGLRRFSA